MNFVSIETPSASVATAGQTFEFLDALFRIVAARLFLEAVPDESPDVSDDRVRLLPESRKKTVAGHGRVHRLIIRELEFEELLRRGKPRLYGSAGCSAGAELCVSIA